VHTSASDVVDKLDLGGYHAYHATEPTCSADSAARRLPVLPMSKAIELAGNTAEVAYLARRRDQLGPN
jgi:RNA polymerase sigma-70 factor, ECF subfamily